MAQRRKKTSHRQERKFTVRSVRRDPVDMTKLSRALISLARAEAEREAEAQHISSDTTTPPQPEHEGGEPDA